jgi:hypothetical protein
MSFNLLSFEPPNSDQNIAILAGCHETMPAANELRLDSNFAHPDPLGTPAGLIMTELNEIKDFDFAGRVYSTSTVNAKGELHGMLQPSLFTGQMAR